MNVLIRADQVVLVLWGSGTHRLSVLADDLQDALFRVAAMCLSTARHDNHEPTLSRAPTNAMMHDNSTFKSQWWAMTTKALAARRRCWWRRLLADPARTGWTRERGGRARPGVPAYSRLNRQHVFILEADMFWKLLETMGRFRVGRFLGWGVSLAGGRARSARARDA